MGLPLRSFRWLKTQVVQNSSSLEPTTLAFTSVIQKTLPTATMMMDFSTRHYSSPVSLQRLFPAEAEWARFTVDWSTWHCSCNVEFVKPGCATQNSETTSEQHLHAPTAGAGPEEVILWPIACVHLRPRSSSQVCMESPRPFIPHAVCNWEATGVGRPGTPEIALRKSLPLSFYVAICLTPLLTLPLHRLIRNTGWWSALGGCLSVLRCPSVFGVPIHPHAFLSILPPQGHCHKAWCIFSCLCQNENMHNR